MRQQTKKQNIQNQREADVNRQPGIRTQRFNGDENNQIIPGMGLLRSVIEWMYQQAADNGTQNDEIEVGKNKKRERTNRKRG